MGLHTSYLGHLRITPALNDDEVTLIQSFNSTRHCGVEHGPLDVAQHPVDNEPLDVDAYNLPPAGMPELWCPWTCCRTGCCLHWDGLEKPYAPQEWLRYVIGTFLRPGAALSKDVRARGLGLTFDHVLDGTIVGERKETAELFALVVRDNTIRRRVLVPGAEGTDEWGYRSRSEERQSRQEELRARRNRFEAAIAEDVRLAG